MPGNRPIQIVQRITAILYAVAGVEGGCTVPHLSRVTGIKTATLHKIVRTLQIEGLLTRLNHPVRYTLGSTIADLNRLDEQQHLLTVSSEELIRAHARMISSNLVLVIPQEHLCYQRLRCVANCPGRISRLRNHLLEPYIRASTLLCLAYATSSQVRAFYQAHPFETEGKPLWKSRRSLEVFLAKVRRENLSIPPIPDPMFFRVAVPVFSPHHELVAAVGGYVLMSAGPQKHQKLINICRNASQAIMKRLKDTNQCPPCNAQTSDQNDTTLGGPTDPRLG